MTLTSETESLKPFDRAPYLSFKPGPAGLTIAEVVNRHARATVALHGGQVLSFQPHGQQPVLWISRHSHYAADKPIRGGIPVCWPWFGPHSTDSAKPAHGFARISAWRVLGSDVAADETTRLRLGLADSVATRALWPHAFEIALTISIGPILEVDCLVRNPGPAAFTCSGALHSYFAVSDIANVSIHGLDRCAYLDKVASDEARFEQAGPIAITAETDRVYLDTTADCLIADSGWQRTIRVGKRGSRTTVVWNPWVDRARQLVDFGAAEYCGMVCVETANTEDDQVTVPPGGEHRLATAIGLQPSDSER